MLSSSDFFWCSICLRLDNKKLGGGPLLWITSFLGLCFLGLSGEFFRLRVSESTFFIGEIVFEGLRCNLVLGLFRSGVSELGKSSLFVLIDFWVLLSFSQIKELSTLALSTKASILILRFKREVLSWFLSCTFVLVSLTLSMKS